MEKFDFSCVETRFFWEDASAQYFFFLKRRVVLSGADEPDSSEPAKGLKEGVFQM